MQLLFNKCHLNRSLNDPNTDPVKYRLCQQKSVNLERHQKTHLTKESFLQHVMSVLWMGKSINSAVELAKNIESMNWPTAMHVLTETIVFYDSCFADYVSSDKLTHDR